MFHTLRANLGGMAILGAAIVAGLLHWTTVELLLVLVFAACLMVATLREHREVKARYLEWKQSQQNGQG